MLTIRYLGLCVLLLSCSGQTNTTSTPTIPHAGPSGNASPELSSPTAPSSATLAAANSNFRADEATTAIAPVASATSTPTSPQPAVPKFGAIRGHIVTKPVQSAQHAVVYLENAPVEKVVDARLDDHKMTFFPFVSVMTTGGTLTYVNSEPFPDTAFSMSNEKWDFGMVESHGVRRRKFEKAGNYTILCRLHPNQLAFLIVSPSSYFARSDKEGEFKLENVPVGTYDLVAWAPRVKSEKRSVTVTSEEVVLDFDLKK